MNDFGQGTVKVEIWLKNDTTITREVFYKWEENSNEECHLTIQRPDLGEYEKHASDWKTDVIDTVTDRLSRKIEEIHWTD